MQAQLQRVEWSEAELIDIRIRQGEFRPMLVRMRQGLPYILRFTNADDSVRVFNAHEFFDAVAVHRVLIGTEEESATCISAVAVPAHEVVEVHLLAGRDGRYRFEDNPFVWLPFPGGRGLGVVTIAPDVTLRPGALPNF